MAGRVESEFRQRFTAVDQTGRAFRSLNSNLKRTGRGFGLASKALGAFAGALSVRALTQYTKAVSDMARNLQDAADKTGIAVEQFQGLQRVAAEGGINIRSFEMALQRLTRRIGEAANGQGELLKVVENYGLAIRDSEGNIRDTTEVLNDLADIISETESEQEQLFLTTRAFDSEGADFVNILRDGAAGLEAMRKEAERFGIVAGTDIERVTALRKEFDQWAQIIETRTLKALAALSEGIVAVSDSLQNLAAVDDRPALDKNLERRAELMEEIANLQGLIALQVERQGQASVRLTSLLKTAREELTAINAQIAPAQRRRNVAAVRNAPFVGPPSPPTVATGPFPGPPAPARRAFTPITPVGPPVPGTETAAPFQRGSSGLAPGQMGPPVDAARDIKRQVQEVNEFAQEAARSMQNAFSDFFFDPMDDGFRGLAQNFGDTIRRMAADIASQKLLTAFFGQFAGGTGLLADFANQALGAVGGNVIINAPGADASTVARIETVASRTESVIRDNARRGRLT